MDFVFRRPIVLVFNIGLITISSHRNVKWDSITWFRPMFSFPQENLF